MINDPQSFIGKTYSYKGSSWRVTFHSETNDFFTLRQLGTQKLAFFTHEEFEKLTKGDKRE